MRIDRDLILEKKIETFMKLVYELNHYSQDQWNPNYCPAKYVDNHFEISRHLNGDGDGDFESHCPFCGQ